MSEGRVELLFFILFLTLITTSIRAQNVKPDNFNKQFSYSIDNDAFAFRGTDGYYTNGILLNYSLLGKRNRAGIIKTIYNYELSQKIFTPGIREVYVVNELDRPITGYLYGGFSISQFTKNNRYLKLGGTIGTIGPASLGQKLLDAVHPLLKINSDFWDWMFAYGLKNEVGINAQGSYGFSLIKNSTADYFQITPVSNASLGTIYTNISQSVLLQFGKQNSMSESSFWNTRLQSSESRAPRYKTELFGYLQPELTYQVYNATVQGGLLRADKGRLVSKSAPLVFSSRAGIMYSTPRLSGGFHITFQTRETKLQETYHIFGGFHASYRFK
ncbi:MAG: hypothetical protein JWQ40_2589 [Segetibacter sp.]|jgi:lipid A 3-O-deacylase|nr:hypothetical protein [Segetibacter sp.]